MFTVFVLQFLNWSKSKNDTKTLSFNYKEKTSFVSKWFMHLHQNFEISYCKLFKQKWLNFWGNLNPTEYFLLIVLKFINHFIYILHTPMEENLET